MYIATLSDTAQTILLASTIFNWTLSRKIASRPIAYSQNQLLYRKSVQLSIITTLSDWTAVGAEAYAAILPTQKNILSYILLIYGMFNFCAALTEQSCKHSHSRYYRSFIYRYLSISYSYIDSCISSKDEQDTQTSTSRSTQIKRQ